DESGTTVGGADVDLGFERIEQEFGQAEAAGGGEEAARAEFAHGGIGVMTVRQEGEVDLAVAGHPRQRAFEGFPGSAAPGSISIEAEHDLRYVTKELFEMIAR